MKMLDYISNNQDIIPKLEYHFSENDTDFELRPYDLKGIPETENLLIIEPFKVQTGDYYFIHPIWRSFFKQNQQFPNTTKLIVAGFEDFDDPNYINLRSFPASFASVLENAQSLNGDWGIDLNKYEDQQIISRLNQFFKGHDMVSLFQKLTYLDISIKNINYTLTGEIDKSYEEGIEFMFPLSKQHWREFEIRWAIYQPYFECCPFSEEKAEMEALLDQITPFFESDQPSSEMFLKINCVKVLDEIHHCLEKMHRYVRPEKGDC